MKKLIVAAVAAAVIAPAAAMASATMYGKIHMAVGTYDNDLSGNAEYSEMNVSSNASRVGIKGSEDLGSGMKVVYDVQFGMNVDSNKTSGGLSGRHSYIGLAGGFGTVLLGSLSSPTKVVGIKTNLFVDRMGDVRGLSSASDEGYLDNVIAYASPNMGGFSITAAYTTDFNSTQDNVSTATTPSTDDAAWSANAIYSNGGIMVGIGHTDLMDISDKSTTRIGASVKMGAVKVVGGYTMNKNVNAANDDHNDYTLGAAYTMGSNTLKAQYTAQDHDNAIDASQITVAVDHSMSKRTTVYAEYSKVSDGGTAWAKTGVATVNGNDSSGFAVGLIHKF